MSSGSPAGRLARLLAVVALLASVPVAEARASLEEFSTFNVEEQERDDESLLDHLLTRPPRAWRDEWERSTLVVRSAQGCLTAGQWFNRTDLRLRTAIGRRAWFAFALHQDESDRYLTDYTEFSVHFATRFGTAGYSFRPARDKASQDMGLMWDVGSDTSAFQLHLVYGLEDVFNNFWEFRQVEVGGRSEPYLRHPWEPGLRMVLRRPGLRAELGGRWLTPGTRRLITTLFDPSQDRISTLWGTLAWASVEARALGVDWEAATTNHQASSTLHPKDVPLPDGRDFRRQWSFEAAARRQVAPRWSAEARWVYQERTQDHAPPVDPPRFAAVDRLIQLETIWSATPSLSLRLGAMRDRIGVAWSAVTPYSYGSRSEDRAYLGVILHFGALSLQAVEGIELDHEPYNVWLVHDKGFLQAQARF